MISSPFTENQWMKLRKIILQKYSYEHLIDDHRYIQRQVQILQQFKDKIDRKKTFDSFSSFSLTNISSIQNLDNTEDSSFMKSKFTEEFQFSIINSALKEVKNSCSQQTYQTVRGYIMNNKQKQYQNLQKILEKKTKQNQELSTTIIIKQRDNSNLQKELLNLRQKQQQIQEEKKKNKKRLDLVMQKQNRISKIQMALVFKEKLNLEGKRRYQRQYQVTSEIIKKMQKIQFQLNLLWDKILKYCEEKRCQCLQQCWKKQVMRRVKQKILQQKNLLKQEQAQLENEYLIMQNISDQFKKIFSLNQIQKQKSTHSSKISSNQ